MRADRAAQKPRAAWCPAHGSGPTPAAGCWNCKWSALPRRRTSAAGKARTGFCAFFAGCAFFAREHLHFCVSCGNIIRQYCLLQAYALVAQPVEHLTFNQRARDSSSLERTKRTINRCKKRFVVFFVLYGLFGFVPMIFSKILEVGGTEKMKKIRQIKTGRNTMRFLHANKKKPMFFLNVNRSVKSRQ